MKLPLIIDKNVKLREEYNIQNKGGGGGLVVGKLEIIVKGSRKTKEDRGRGKRIYCSILKQEGELAF